MYKRKGTLLLSFTRQQIYLYRNRGVTSIHMGGRNASGWRASDERFPPRPHLQALASSLHLLENLQQQPGPPVPAVSLCSGGHSAIGKTSCISVLLLTIHTIPTTPLATASFAWGLWSTLHSTCSRMIKMWLKSTAILQQTEVSFIILTSKPKQLLRDIFKGMMTSGHCHHLH